MYVYMYVHVCICMCMIVLADLQCLWGEVCGSATGVVSGWQPPACSHREQHYTSSQDEGMYKCWLLHPDTFIVLLVCMYICLFSLSLSLSLSLTLTPPPLPPFVRPSSPPPPPLFPPSLPPSFPTYQTQCINNWVHANKKETPEEDKVVHVAWLDYRPMATIHHAKEDWREVMEFQPFSSQLRMLLGNAFIAITSKGKVAIHNYREIIKNLFIYSWYYLCLYWKLFTSGLMRVVDVYYLADFRPVFLVIYYILLDCGLWNNIICR